MASRNFNRLQALDKEVKHLHADIAIGASGAPTLGDDVGFASISRVSAGLYDLVLQDQYVKLLGVDIVQLVASAQDLHFQIVSESVTASGKTLRFRCLTAAVATDPASGSILYVKLALKNSSAK